MCEKWLSWLTLAVGVLYLIVDLSPWKFWGIQWWTAAFVLVGLCYLTKRK